MIFVVNESVMCAPEWLTFSECGTIMNSIVVWFERKRQSFGWCRNVLKAKKTSKTSNWRKIHSERSDVDFENKLDGKITSGLSGRWAEVSRWWSWWFAPGDLGQFIRMRFKATRSVRMIYHFDQLNGQSPHPPAHHYSSQAIPLSLLLSSTPIYLSTISLTKCSPHNKPSDRPSTIDQSCYAFNDAPRPRINNVEHFYLFLFRFYPVPWLLIAVCRSDRKFLR